MLQGVLLIGIALFITGCGTEISVDHESMGPKPNLSSYAWLPNTVKDPQIDAPHLNNIVKKAVDKELAAKGYTLDTRGKATFLVTYHAVISEEVKTVTINNHVDKQAAAYVGDAQYYTPQMKEMRYDQGTLILDFMKANDPSNYWRGSAKAKVHLNDSRENHDKRIQQAVAEIEQSTEEGLPGKETRHQARRGPRHEDRQRRKPPGRQAANANAYARSLEGVASSATARSASAIALRRIPAEVRAVD